MTNSDQVHLSISPLFAFMFAEGLNPSGIPKALNLIIFLLVIYYLVRKPARQFFSQRLAEVRTMLDRAEKEKAEATAKLSEIEARLARLDIELAGIRAQAEQEAAAERARLESETQAETERLRRMAAREIESAKQSAIVELREFAAERSVELAEKIIRRELTPEDDRRLVERASAEMEQL
jgi:F-type H+-transporting ATPase subunit b